MTEAEAKRALEGSQIALNLEAARTAVEEECKKLGITAKELTDDELTKILKDKGIAATKEDFVKATKEDAKKAVEPMLEKLKLPSKTWTGIAAGAVLALAGFGIGYLAKKDQI